MIRRNLIALGVAVAGLVALPAVASAGEEILAKASYDDTTTYSVPHERAPDQPGPEPQPLRRNHRRARTRSRSATAPASASAFGSSDAGLHHPLQAEHGRDRRRGRSSRRASTTFISTTSSGSRSGSPTFASGEEKTEVKLPQGYGIRTAANADLDPQLHDPQPQRSRTAGRSTSPGRSTGCRWRATPRRRSSSRRRSRWLGRRRRPADSIRSSTPSGASMTTATATSSSPTTSRTRARRSEPRGGGEDLDEPRVDRAGRRPDAGLRRRPPPSRRAQRRPRGRPRRRLTQASWTATIRPR